MVLFFMHRLSPGVSEGHRAWDDGRCEWAFGVRANRIRLISGRKICEHSACGSGSSSLPAQECGVWARGREERSPSFPLTAAEKQGNDSLKANCYLQVMLCCVLRARYY